MGGVIKVKIHKIRVVFCFMNLFDKFSKLIHLNKEEREKKRKNPFMWQGEKACDGQKHNLCEDVFVNPSAAEKQDYSPVHHKNYSVYKTHKGVALLERNLSWWFHIFFFNSSGFHFYFPFYFITLCFSI